LPEDQGQGTNNKGKQKGEERTRRRRDTLGLPVLKLDGGKKMGEVRELIFDGERKSLDGVLIKEDTLLSGGQVVQYSDIHSLGLDAVTLRKGSEVLKWGDLKKRREQASQAQGWPEPEKLLGKRLVTEAGRDLGMIDDLIFDAEEGKLEGYELSGGLIKDVVDGKGFVPVPEQVILGTDTVIVPADVEDTVQRSPVKADDDPEPQA